METHVQDCALCRKTDVCKFKVSKQEAEAHVEADISSDPDYNFLTVSLLCNFFDPKPVSTT